MVGHLFIWLGAWVRACVRTCGRVYRISYCVCAWCVRVWVWVDACVCMGCVRYTHAHTYLYEYVCMRFMY